MTGGAGLVAERRHSGSVGIREDGVQPMWRVLSSRAASALQCSRRLNGNELRLAALSADLRGERDAARRGTIEKVTFE